MGVALITTIMGTAVIMTARIMTGIINVVLEVEMAACSTTGLGRGIFIDLLLFLLCLLAPRPFGLMGIIWATLRCHLHIFLFHLHHLSPSEEFPILMWSPLLCTTHHRRILNCFLN